MLPTQASAFSVVKTETPDAFVVVFPAANAKERDYCESERAKIQTRLVEELGANISLKLVLDPDAKPRSGAGNASTAARDARPRERANDATRRVDYRDLRRRVEESEIARRLQEYFGAELADVKPPTDKQKPNPK